MKTIKQNIERNVFVYAQARTSYELENMEPGELPFTYRVKEFDYGDENCVRILEQAVLIAIPAGIDLTIECMKNLEEKIVAVQKDADDEIKDLRGRISALALIEYKPQENTDDTTVHAD